MGNNWFEHSEKLETGYNIQYIIQHINVVQVSAPTTIANKQVTKQKNVDFEVSAQFGLCVISAAFPQHSANEHIGFNDIHYLLHATEIPADSATGYQVNER